MQLPELQKLCFGIFGEEANAVSMFYRKIKLAQGPG